MNNFKKFVFKYKIIFGILIFLLISFGVYFFVFAEEDEYANQIEVKNPSILIKDGTPNSDGNFDSSDEAGNDSSDSNGKVRNFDSIQYTISYDIGYKASSTMTGIGMFRNVILDVLVPENVNATVASGDVLNPIGGTSTTLKIGDTSYKYYKFEENVEMLSTGQQKNFNIVIYDINMPNGSVISPIIRVRESTDLNYADFDSNSSLSSNVLNVNPVTVTSVDKWGAKLFAGAASHNSDRTEASLPIGVVIYIPNDTNKGIKGANIPSTLDLALSVSPSVEGEAALSASSISDYDSSTLVIHQMPDAHENNGTIGKDNITQSGNVFTLHFSNLTYNSGEINLDSNSSVKYLSSKTFVLTSKRNSSSKNNITYTIGGTNVIGTSIIDSYEPVVGDYASKVNFKNSRTDTSVVEDNSAVYNYGEEFYIENDITYASKIGDSLPSGFTNYLKIDNTAIRLLDIENKSDNTKDYFIQMDSNASYSAEVKYAVGEWNSNYFSIKSNAPSYCPTNLSSLSKEQLMNYYGGPCIEENSQVKWYDSIAASSNSENIIIVKTTISGEFSNGTISVYNKASIKKSSSLSGNTYQITSRGVTNFNNEIFYMSNPSDGIPVNVSKQTSDITYTKMTYSNGVIGNSVSGGQDGNSLLVTNAKAKILNIVTKDKYDAENKSIYASQNDPLTIQISPSIVTSDLNASVGDVYIDVYLPKTLTIDVQTGDKTYKSVKETTYLNENYNVYTYYYTAEEIKSSEVSASGTIPTLTVHANVSLTTKDATNSTIYSKVYGYVKIDDKDVAINNPDSEKISGKSILLYNKNDISLLGIASPTYIDNNGTYTYNVKAYNSSNSSAQLDLLYVLPFNGDGISGEYGSSFKGTIKSSIVGTIPNGYTVYYTTDDAKTILSNEVSSSASVNWKAWTSYNSELSNVTAIKITASNSIAVGNYFASENGITFKFSTSGNKEADIYYNNFYIFHKDSGNCNGNACNENTNVYSSNVSSSSVYNRTISGKVFIDEDFDGFSNDGEERVSDIAIDLYKIEGSIEDSNDPLSVISDNDTKILETTTNTNGVYSFKGLTIGSYYVKYTFDCDKYTVTEKNKTDVSKGDTSTVDSDAVLISGTCSAVSNIITLNNDNINALNIDLGLRLRQIFDVSVNKYITNVTVTSNRGVESHDYDHAKQVKLDVKTLKNTSFRVTYTIEIENTKYFPGTIGYIIETIPSDMTFDPNVTGNEGWTESDGYLYYTDLSSSLLLPGEKHYITIVLDLVTESGGDFVNFVAVSDLQVQSLTTDFTEVIDDNDYTTVEEEASKDEMGEGE